MEYFLNHGGKIGYTHVKQRKLDSSLTYYAKINSGLIKGLIGKNKTFKIIQVGGGIRMGNTCKSMADSCMAKTTTIL